MAIEFDAGQETIITLKVQQATSFNFTFGTAPGVHCTNDGATAAKGHGATSITTTGFDIYSEVQEECYWIARDQDFDDGTGGAPAPFIFKQLPNVLLRR